jgi:hypothetical protein
LEERSRQKRCYERLSGYQKEKVGYSGKYKEQSFEEAMDKGEVFQFKSQKAAERFAKGSWKKKRDRK